MKLEIEKDVIRDMITQFGVNWAITELTAGFRAVLDADIEEIEQEVQEEIKGRRSK